MRALLLLSILLITSSWAKEELINISSSGERIRISSGFGSAQDGHVTVDLSVTVNSEPDYIFKCPPHLPQCETLDHVIKEEDLWFQFVIFDDNQRFDSLYYTGTDACILPSYYRQEFSKSFSQEILLKAEDYYHVYVMNSRKADINIECRFVWKQRDGGLLSYEVIPNQWTSALGFIVSAVTTIVWIVVLVKRWHYVTMLHNAMLFICLFQVLHFLLEFINITAEAHGVSIPILSATQLPLIFRVTAETILMGFILLVSVGWGILAYSLSLRSKQLFTAAILLYGGFDFLCSLCLYPQVLCTVYELFFNVIKFLIFFSALIALNSAAELLRSEFYLQHPHRRKMVLQIMLFCNLRYLLMPLMSVPVTIIFLEFTILSWQESWVSPFINNCLFILSVWWLGYELRPQSDDDARVYLIRRPALIQVAEEENDGPEQELVNESEEEDVDEEEEEEVLNPGEDIEMQVFASDGVL